MADFRLTAPAEKELDEILDWSEARFHETGRKRYITLLLLAMQDIAENPQRNGVSWVRTSKALLGIYHVKNSRKSILDPLERVQEPRHQIIFRIAEDGVVDILGFAHDSMLLERALRRIIRASTLKAH